MKKSENCSHENLGTMTIGGVTFTRLTICNDCGKLLNEGKKNTSKSCG